MALLDLITGLGSEEEVGGSVGVKRAKETLFCDTIPEENHALAGILLIDKTHFIDSVGGIVQEGQEVIKDPRLIGDPFMGASVEVEHHAGERFSGSSKTVFISFPRLLDFARSL